MLQIGILVYADDTTWITKNQEDIQKTKNIAKDFYCLNDIKINPNKTKLIVMCPKKRKNREELCVLIGDPEIKVFAKNQKETTCFL